MRLVYIRFHLLLLIVYMYQCLCEIGSLLMANFLIKNKVIIIFTPL